MAVKDNGKGLKSFSKMQTTKTMKSQKKGWNFSSKSGGLSVEEQKKKLDTRNNAFRTFKPYSIRRDNVGYQLYNNQGQTLVPTYYNQVGTKLRNLSQVNTQRNGDLDLYKKYTRVEALINANTGEGQQSKIGVNKLSPDAIQQLQSELQRLKLEMEKSYSPIKKNQNIAVAKQNAEHKRKENEKDAAKMASRMETRKEIGKNQSDSSEYLAHKCQQRTMKLKQEQEMKKQKHEEEQKQAELYRLKKRDNLQSCQLQRRPGNVSDDKKQILRAVNLYNRNEQKTKKDVVGQVVQKGIEELKSNYPMLYKLTQGENYVTKHILKKPVKTNHVNPPHFSTSRAWVL